MFPTERAVTCQLLATADSMMAWRIANPGGAEGEELRHTTVFLLSTPAGKCCAENPNSRKEELQAYSGFQQWLATCLISYITTVNKLKICC